ncbi:MAG: NADH-quinone oxidoreductase subunit D, partial [Acidobacteriota bacterium]
MSYKTETIEPGKELLTVNMGPSHPATHGVLRLILTLDGERVVKAEPVMGYLHRGMEKIAENQSYTQFIPYTDRLDYL